MMGWCGDHRNSKNLGIVTFQSAACQCHSEEPDGLQRRQTRRVESRIGRATPDGLS
jgi:hypothetical protein